MIFESPNVTPKAFMHRPTTVVLENSGLLISFIIHYDWRDPNHLRDNTSGGAESSENESYNWIRCTKRLHVTSSCSLLWGSSLIDIIFIDRNSNSKVNNRNNSDSPIILFTLVSLFFINVIKRHICIIVRVCYLKCCKNSDT